jgi:hyperosmotically inducible protein
MTRLGFLAALGGVALAQNKKKVHKQTEADPGTGNKGYDRLVREIRHELIMLPNVSVFDDLAFVVEGYNVTLLGAVTRPVLKSSAENVVKRIEGVERIDNRIEVLPLSPQDDRIRVAAARVVFGHPSLNRYALQAIPPIRIIVKNGNLTLSGVVATEADKNIAGIEANTVPGVFKVTNDLRIDKGR